MRGIIAYSDGRAQSPAPVRLIVTQIEYRHPTLSLQVAKSSTVQRQLLPFHIRPILLPYRHICTRIGLISAESRLLFPRHCEHARQICDASQTRRISARLTYWRSRFPALFRKLTVLFCTNKSTIPISRNAAKDRCGSVVCEPCPQILYA